jgi:hypothetical protein
MKTLLVALFAFAAVSTVIVPARADVRIGVPGVHVDIGPHHHWYHHDYCYYHRCW